MGQIDGQDP